MPSGNRRVATPRVGDEPTRALAQAQKSNQDALDSLWAQAIVNGVLLTRVPLAFTTGGSAAPSPAKHSLNRKAKGYLVVGKGAHFDVWDSVLNLDANNPSPSSQIMLGHNAPQTTNAWVSLWVF